MFNVKINVNSDISIKKSRDEVRLSLIEWKMYKKWIPRYNSDSGWKFYCSWEKVEKWWTNNWNSEIIWEWRQICTDVIEPNKIKFNLELYKPFSIDWKSELKLNTIWEYTNIYRKVEINLPLYLFFLKDSLSNVISTDLNRWLKMLKYMILDWDVFTNSEITWRIKLWNFYYMGIKRIVSWNSLKDNLIKDYEKINEIYKRDDNDKYNNQYIIYNKIDFIKNIFEYTAAYEITEEEYEVLVTTEEITKWQIKSSEYFKFTHTWKPELIWNCWSMAFLFLKNKWIKNKKWYYWIEKYTAKIWNSIDNNKRIIEIFIPIEKPELLKFSI